jgi:16S rRNA (adenine1518-N6/adenine1519-N6)-dimethyltransferase
VRHSRLATPSATRAVLEEHGIRLRKSLGQHFLVDDNIVGRILDLARIDPDDVVLEIGPGIGTLTLALLDHAAGVVAVERDATLLPVLEDVSAGLPLTLVEADAVDVDPARLVSPAGPPVAMVANLPYNVAATVVLRLLQEMPSIASATVMVQAEVADRMVASPGGKDYGAYTVKLRLLAEPAGRFNVPAACFMPPPRVDSAVLRLERVHRDEDAAVLSAAGGMASAAFAQRRKTVRNSLLSALGSGEKKVDEALVTAGVDGSRRAETLSVEEYVSLGRAALALGLQP